MYRYIQRDATILSWILFQDLSHVSGINHAHHQEFITASAVIGIT
jgi:hypothetical protein